MWDTFVSVRDLNFFVARKRDVQYKRYIYNIYKDIIVRAGRVCAGTGFPIYHGTTRLSRIPHKTAG